MSSTHIFSSFSTSRARFLYRSFPSYFRTGISSSQYTVIVCRNLSELRNEVVPSRETGNSHHYGDNEPASPVNEQFDRREKSFRRKSRIFERMTQVASTGLSSQGSDLRELGEQRLLISAIASWINKRLYRKTVNVLLPIGVAMLSRLTHRQLTRLRTRSTMSAGVS